MSLLREVAISLAIEANSTDPLSFVDQAALLIREAGLEHLVTVATLAEVQAMSRAGAKLEKDKAARLAVTLRDVPGALQEYDGGAAVRREMLDVMSVPLGKGGSSG